MHVNADSAQRVGEPKWRSGIHRACIISAKKNLSAFTSAFLDLGSYLPRVSGNTAPSPKSPNWAPLKEKKKRLNYQRD